MLKYQSRNNSADQQAADPLARIRSLPKAPAPNDDPSSIRGNISTENNQLNLNVLAYHFGDSKTGGSYFGSEEAKGLKLVESNARPKHTGDGNVAGPIEIETVFEVDVTKGMLNVHGIVAGACLMLLFDYCTFYTFVAAGLEQNADFTGVSTAMDMKWHSPTLPGASLRIVSSTIVANTRSLAARSEIFDKRTGKLLVSAVHTGTPLSKRPSQPKQKL